MPVSFVPPGFGTGSPSIPGGLGTTTTPGVNDPGYKQLQGLYQAQSVEDAKRRQQAIQQALIDYGSIPDFSGLGVDPNLLGQDVTDLVKNLANQNTTAGLSQTARMQHEHEANMRRIADLLAARGILQSGELGYQVGEEGLQYKQLQYGAMRSLLDYINQANTGFAQSERDRQLGLFNAQRDAALRQQEMQLQMQQAAMEQAYQAQQAAAASQGGGYGYTDPGAFAPPPPPPIQGPNAQQLLIMDAAAHKKAIHRTQQEQALFAQYADWRAANPGWQNAQ